MKSFESSTKILNQWKQSRSMSEDILSTESISFIQSLDQLKSYIPHLSSMIRTITITRPKDLNQQEFDALRLVALPWFPSNESFVSITNDFIQRNDPLDYAVWFPYLKLVEQAIDQLPSIRTKTIFYRHLSADCDPAFFIGERFFWSGLLTCTSTAIDLNFDQGTVLVFHCKKGKDISEFSTNKFESLILLPFNVEFQIVRHERPSKNLQHIIIEEIGLLTKSEKNIFKKLTKSIEQLNLQRFDQVEKLSELSLTGKNIDDSLMDYVARMILMKKQVLWLSLMKNQITSDGLMTLTETLSKEVPLESLHLSENRLSKDKIQLWMPSLFRSCQSLTFLNLSQNSIGDAGAETLAKILKTNRTLRDLWLSQTGITNAGAQTIAKTLIDSNRNLVQLYLDHNRSIDDKSVDYFVLMLTCNRSLDTLFLNDCSFSKKAKNRLIATLDHCENFTLDV